MSEIIRVDAGGRPLGDGVRRFAEPGELHVNAPLSQVAQDFGNEDSEYIADILCPRVQVAKQKFEYFVHDMKAFRVEGDAYRPAKGAYAKIDWTPTTASGTTRDRGFEYPMSDEEREVADDGAEPNIVTAKRLTGHLRNLLENEVATLLTTLGNFASARRTTLTGTDQWSDTVNSDPLDDVDTAIAAIHAAGGGNPTWLEMGYQVWQKVRRHPKLLRAFNVDTFVTDEMMAEAFGVPKIIVGRALYDTANSGQTFSGGYIWGKHVVIGNTPPAPSKYTPALAYNFALNRVEIESYDSRSNRVTWFRSREECIPKMISTACGYLIRDAVA